MAYSLQIKELIYFMYNNKKITINDLSIENSEKLNNAIIFRENSKFSLAINCLEEMQGNNLENPIIYYKEIELSE